MQRVRSYLDHNATSPARPAVRAACMEALGLGNPSSVHGEGRSARAAIEAARRQVAALVGARPGEVIFTSGGTEANNLALRPRAMLTRSGRPVRRLVAGAGEHVSVLQGHGFGGAAQLTIDGDGLVDLDQLAWLLQGDEPTLVSVQLANNETGAVQPIRRVAAVVQAADAALHVDAVQGPGRIEVELHDLGADALTLSAHKLGGPMGAGALVVREDRVGPGLRLLAGGGQERGFRAGTENVPGLVGFGVAAEIAGREAAAEGPRLRALRDEAEAAVLALAPAVVFVRDAERLPNTLAFGLPGVRAETVLIGLDLAGVAVSSGSACSSGKVGRSHVLAAMGVPADLAAGAIRVSFGWNSTRQDVKRLVEAFETVVQRLYEGRPARAA